MNVYNKNGIILEYVVNYKKIKNTYFRIRSNRVYITTNNLMSTAKIEDLISKHLVFILKRLNKQISLYDYQVEKTILFFGTKYEYIETKSTKNSVIVTGLTINCFYKTDPKKVVDTYYKRILIEKVNELISETELNTKQKAALITVKKLKSKWGSCAYQSKKIVINSALTFLDLRFLKYVLFHEYCHLLYPNHSKEYYRFLESCFPDYLNTRKELRKYALA